MASSIRKRLVFRQGCQPRYVEMVHAGGVAAGDFGRFVVGHARQDLRQTLEDAREDHVAHRQCRIERLVGRLLASRNVFSPTPRILPCRRVAAESSVWSGGGTGRAISF
jgi:hypothetical protein